MGGREGGSATDQNTALRMRARRGEEQSKHVKKQDRQGRKAGKLTGNEGQKTSVNILVVMRPVSTEVMHAKPSCNQVRK